MKKSRKEFIKKAHSAACSEWKKNIEAEFPNLFKTKSFKKGDWIVSRLGSVINVQEAGYDLCLKPYLHGYGVDYVGDWVDNYKAFPISCRLATEEEVSQALIAEAEKRGFKKGAKLKRLLSVNQGSLSGDSNTCEDKAIKIHRGHLFIGNLMIFHETEGWAEIVETITKEQAEKELGKTIIV